MILRKHVKNCRIIFLLFLKFFFFHAPVNAQSATENQLKASYIYNFLKTMEWPDEGSINAYKVEMFGEDIEMEALLYKLQAFKVRNKTIKVSVCTSIETIHTPNILFISNSKNYLVKDIFSQLKGKSTLIITDNFPSQQYIMINFVTRKNGKLQFEINTKNLEESHFHSSPKLVVLGGSEIDVRKLYQETEQSLVSEKEKSSSYEKELELRKNQINEANAKLTQLNVLLSEQEIKLQLQKDEMAVLGAQIEQQKTILNTKNTVLKSQQTEIINKEKQLNEEQLDLLSKRTQIEAYEKTLQGQKKEIDKRQTIISHQGQTLYNQVNVIKTQKAFLYLLSALILIVFGLIIITLRSFILIRKKTKQLEIVNTDLISKNLEIQTQAFKLEQKNNELERINYELSASRQEILEQKEELSRTLLKLTEAQQRLIQSEKMASLGTLVAGIAHEINNPINFINSGINGLEKVFDKLIIFLTELNQIKTDVPEPTLNRLIDLKNNLKLTSSLELLPEIMSNIKLGVDRTISITNGLRLYSRIDKDEMSNRLINDIIDTALLLIKPQIKGNLEIQKDYKATTSCLLYPGKLSQVFINLLTNAIDAIHEKGDPETNYIRIRTWENETTVFVEFNDTGPGIPNDKINKIFDPFFTTKLNTNGTGLGLSISLGIIEEHNGHITASNNSDGGAKFTIAIPKN